MLHLRRESPLRPPLPPFDSILISNQPMYPASNLTNQLHTATLSIAAPRRVSRLPPTEWTLTLLHRGGEHFPKNMRRSTRSTVDHVRVMPWPAMRLWDLSCRSVVDADQFDSLALQSQKVVAAYFSSKQLLPFGYAWPHPEQENYPFLYRSDPLYYTANCYFWFTPSRPMHPQQQ